MTTNFAREVLTVTSKISTPYKTDDDPFTLRFSVDSLFADRTTKLECYKIGFDLFGSFSGSGPSSSAVCRDAGSKCFALV